MFIQVDRVNVKGMEPVLINLDSVREFRPTKMIYGGKEFDWTRVVFNKHEYTLDNEYIICRSLEELQKQIAIIL